MPFLVDNNLSPKIAETLSVSFPHSLHVMALNMDTAEDGVIWDYAKGNNLTILTKDNDFEARSRLHGCPPKVVQLKCGNKKTGEILSILRTHFSFLHDFLQASEDCLLMIN